MYIFVSKLKAAKQSIIGLSKLKYNIVNLIKEEGKLVVARML